MATATTAEKAAQTAPYDKQDHQDRLKAANQTVVDYFLSGDHTQRDAAFRRIFELADLDETFREANQRRKTADLPPLQFWTPAELALHAEPSPNWIIRGMLAPQVITELDGKIKRSGKTTLILAAIRAILDGEAFLDLPTRPTNAVYVTEQQHNPFATALQRAGLLDRPDGLSILFRRDMKHRTWDDIVKAAVEHCQATNAEILVFDTISKLARIRDENNADAWDDILSPLQDAAQDANLAIWLARHSRKMGGEVGDTGRGSSAASGDVDIIFDLHRPEGNTPTSRRILESTGRYSDVTPEKIVLDFDLTTGRYAYLGNEDAVAITEAANFVRDTIEKATETNDGEGPTLADLTNAGKEANISRTSIQRGIEHLEKQRLVKRSGAGVKGNPQRYHVVPA